MNLGELREEVVARGAAYLTQDTAGTDRANRWINQAYLEICESAAWPFLETEVTSVSPVVEDDFRTVLSVLSGSWSLDYIDRRILLERSADLSLEGTPLYYYFEGVDQIKTYPASTDELTVRYIRVPEELSNDAEIPEIPRRFHDLIVDGAMLRVLKDTDNFDNLQALEGFYSTRLETMRASYTGRPDREFVQVLDSTDWVW